MRRPSGRADRDVLQVRVGGREPPGGGHRLVEGGVDAAGLGIHELGQSVDVGRLQLLHRAVVEDPARQLVDERQLLEHVLGGGGGARLGGLLAALQAEPVEEHLAQLHGRVDVELALGENVDLGRERLELGLHLAAHAREELGVDLHAGPLHVGEHENERHLHRLVDRTQALGLEALAHRRLEPQHQLGLGPGGARGGNGRGVRRSDAVGPGRAPLAEVLHRHVLEGVGPAPGVEQVGGDERVEVEARDTHAQPLEHDAVALGVGRDLSHRGVLEQRTQRRHRLGPRGRLRQVDRGVAERHVGRAAGRPRERQPERVGPHRLGARHDDTERHPAGRAGLLHHGVDLGPRQRQALIGRGWRHLRRVVAREHLELELLEERVRLGRVGPREPQRVELERYGYVLAQRDELLREQRLGAVGFQALAVGGSLDLVGVVEHGLERAELADQVARALVADAGDSRVCCPPSRPRAPARPRSARAGRPTSPRRRGGRSSSSRCPRGPGSARARGPPRAAAGPCRPRPPPRPGPGATAWRESVAITSSASKPGTSITGMRSAAHTRRM